MRIVINNNFGGFCAPVAVVNAVEQKTGNYSVLLPYYIPRDNEELVNYVEELYKNPQMDPDSTLVIVDIPDNATDYEIVEYDGCETVHAVIDGKIVHLYGRERGEYNNGISS